MNNNGNVGIGDCTIVISSVTCKSRHLLQNLDIMYNSSIIHNVGKHGILAGCDYNIAIGYQASVAITNNEKD